MGFNDAVEKTLSSWMKKDGPEGDIVLGTRLRLARNLTKIPFPAVAEKDQMRHVLTVVGTQAGKLEPHGNFTFLKMAEVEALERHLMVEKHLISPVLTENTTHKGVLLSENEDISIMVNEEDHLRIQVLFPGLQLEPAWALISKIDDAFEENLDYAFDEDQGYLTACPTNVGTGMRASVMMHVPALARVGQLSKVFANISQFGLSVRGLYGEGSESYGNIYQISNQITLGHTEEETIEHLLKISMQVITAERQARDYLLKPERRLAAEDRSYRSFGILANARVMTTKEAMELLSDVRLGIDLRFLTGLDTKILKELMVLIRAAHLQKVMGVNLPSDERDRLRASLIRDKLELK